GLELVARHIEQFFAAPAVWFFAPAQDDQAARMRPARLAPVAFANFQVWIIRRLPTGGVVAADFFNVRAKAGHHDVGQPALFDRAQQFVLAEPGVHAQETDTR